MIYQPFRINLEGKFEIRSKQTPPALYPSEGFDYTQPGAYFITMVTYQRECLFGEVVDGEMVLDPWGCVADECWRAIPDHFPNVELGAYVAIPNHLHGIMVIRGRGTIYRALKIHLDHQ